MKKVTIKSHDQKLELFLQIKEVENPKAIIQISHGMAEHKERYLEFMEYLNQKGYTTAIHDHRGHGQSIKQNNDLGYFYDNTGNEIVEDLHEVTLYLKKTYPNTPIYMFAHSMGTLVARNYLKKYDNQIDKLILSGPPAKRNLALPAIFLTLIISILKGPYHRSKLLDHLTFGNYNQKFKSENSKQAWITNSQTEQIKYKQDKLCGYTFTTNGFKNLYKLMYHCYQKNNWQKKNPNLPILFIAGENDPVIRNQKHFQNEIKFLNKIGYSHIQSKQYPNNRHEIINGKDKKQVRNDIINWIEKECK